MEFKVIAFSFGKTVYYIDAAKYDREAKGICAGEESCSPPHPVSFREAALLHVQGNIPTVQGVDDDL